MIKKAQTQMKQMSSLRSGGSYAFWKDSWKEILKQTKI